MTHAVARRIRWTAGRLGVGLALVLATACVPPRGGWDAASLLAARPDLAAIPGQRLGDLTPYPALPDGFGAAAEGAQAGGPAGSASLLLVACRHAPGTRLVLRPEGADWPAEWARAAVDALDAGRLDLALELGAFDAPAAAARDRSRPAAAAREDGARLAVVSLADPDAAGPAGLGDTLTLCDVSPVPRGLDALDVRPRGELVGGRVRLRRRQRRPTGRVHEATREEWVAAFLHELAHALGFAGHAAAGDSPVHREQSALRGLARRALRGEALSLPNLHALYGLGPGERLGRAELAPSGAEAIRRVQRAVAARSARRGPAEGPLASVGDREARLAWRWPDGHALDVRFPRYVEELRRGEPITAEPGPRTRRAGSVGADRDEGGR